MEKTTEKSFYVTTPIYYVNDQPHIGHAYTTVAADVLSRYHRQRGHNVFFLTGTDEHGQKVEQAAKEKNRSPLEHADLLVKNFQDLWQKLNISNDAFIRTTDEKHKQVVSELLTKLHAEGKIVKRTYTGSYCTPCERFWTDKDLREGKCPECSREVEEISEANYFFLMSQYKDQLLKHIEENPRYILPETRKNEVLGFLNSQDLGDLCISRPKKRLSWGVPLPFDSDYVTYVWFDALLNYYSATRYLDKNNKGFWPATHHLIGKDILTTHAVYWSTMLMAAGLPLPLNIFAHGWWTVEGTKMSKSLGNVVDPFEVVDKYGTDAFRYFLMREVPFGLDGDFSESALAGRINTDLANDLGNLVSRTLTLIEQKLEGTVPDVPAETGEAEAAILAKLVAVEFEKDTLLNDLKFSRVLTLIWNVIAEANRYIDTAAPWKETDADVLGRVFYTLSETLRQIALHIYPFMPGAAQGIWTRLGIAAKVGGFSMQEANPWGNAVCGLKVKKGKPLFPRIETDKTREKKKEKQDKQPRAQKQAPVSTDGLIKIDAFMAVELKTAKVLVAEAVEGSEKLLRLEVDSGEPGQRRQIVAGIADAYAPEDLVGKTVVVVANLKPAKLMGIKSEGMLLAATGVDGKPSVLMPDRESPPGVRIK